MKIKFSPNKAGGKIFSYHLMIKRGEGNWSGGAQFLTTNEMRETARALIKMADKLDKEEELSDG